MNEHINTLPSGFRALGGAAGRTTDGLVFISVAEVMLGTAAATSITRPRSAVREWWARLSAIRAEQRRVARRRPDYFEHAAMAREMYRL